MVKPIASVKSMTGIRRTSSSDVARVLVEAYHNTSLGEVDRVEFVISSNGGASATTTVTTRQVWLPDDTDSDDPLPGDWGGGPAPLECYGIELAMSAYAAGYITVVPTVYPDTGESLTLDTVIIYNDKDGTDRRPTNKVIYWDYNGGNDSNSGTSSGNAVKTFQKASELVATSNDCGGGTIYIDATGIHLLGSYSAYAFGANLFTGGNHWLLVTPRPGLSKDDVRIVRVSNNDAEWMNFAGNSTNQFARLRFKNLTIQTPGIVFNSGTNISMHTWIDGVTVTSAAPYDSSPNGVGIDIRIYDSRGGPVGVNNFGPSPVFYATAVYMHHLIGVSAGQRTRGCHIDSSAAPIMQANHNNEAHTNYFIENIYQNYGTSGYFATITSSNVRIDSIGGNVYRLQATTSYAGEDFSKHGNYLVDSTSFGLLLSSWPTAGNNKSWPVVDAGYSGGIYPYIEFTGAGVTPESASSSSISPGRLSDNSTWETLVHSDIIQFNASVSNIILSTICTQRAYQTQGIYSAGHNLSGVIIYNFSDGKPNSTDVIRSYIVGGSQQNFLLRNSTILGQWEVDSTQTIADIELIDNVFDRFTAYAGSTSAFASASNVNYNHFVTGSHAAGSNTSIGMAFSNADPGANGDTSIDASSTAYGTASSLWEHPSYWFSNNKGVLDNVALADWSYSDPSNVTVTPDPLVSTISIPTATPKVRITPSILGATFSVEAIETVGNLINRSSSGGSAVGSSFSVVSISSLTLIDIPLKSIGGVTSATVFIGRDFIYNVARPVSTYGQVTHIQGVIADIKPPVIIIGSHPTEPTDPSGPIVIGTELPNVGQDPGRPQIPTKPVINDIYNRKENPIDTNFFNSNLVTYDTNNILPVLKELNEINNNVSNLPADSKEIWSQSILENIDSSLSNKEIIKLLTNNYKDFTNTNNNTAGRTNLNRKSF